MENGRVDFTKEHKKKILIQDLVLVPLLLMFLLTNLLQLDLKSGIPYYIGSYIFVVVTRYKRIFNSDSGYLDHEMFIYNKHKVRWENIVSVYKNREKYYILARSGETIIIKGTHKLLEAEFDKHLDYVKSKESVNTAIKRWRAKGRDYVVVNTEDRILMGIGNINVSRKVFFLIIAILITAIVLVVRQASLNAPKF